MGAQLTGLQRSEGHRFEGVVVALLLGARIRAPRLGLRIVLIVRGVALGRLVELS